MILKHLFAWEVIVADYTRPLVNFFLQMGRQSDILVKSKNDLVSSSDFVGNIPAEEIDHVVHFKSSFVRNRFQQSLSSIFAA